jgi:2-oxoglutarate ferredoxin oxidoreductase subunit gamma
MLIVDEEKVGRVPTTRAVKAPITRLAAESTGKVITANVVALGLLVGLSGVVSRAAVEQAVTARAPHGTEEINRAALAAGFAAAERWLASRPAV